MNAPATGRESRLVGRPACAIEGRDFSVSWSESVPGSRPDGAGIWSACAIHEGFQDSDGPGPLRMLAVRRDKRVETPGRRWTIRLSRYSNGVLGTQQPGERLGLDQRLPE